MKISSRNKIKGQYYTNEELQNIFDEYIRRATKKIALAQEKFLLEQIGNKNENKTIEK